MGFTCLRREQFWNRISKRYICIHRVALTQQAAAVRKEDNRKFLAGIYINMNATVVECDAE